MADEIPGLSPSSGNKDGKKDDKKDALPPTLKDFQKTRIKLQGMGPRTLMERLKSFRKKDLLFILSGLGVLVGAPLAEHLMTGGAPSGFQQGWDFKNGLGGFGGGGSPFEPGVNGLAPGQAAGGNGDIITPFNARDPASLILGPEGDEQPPVGAPAAAPSSDNDNGGNGNAPWRNVLAQAGGNAAGAATQSAGLPVASPMLGDDFLGGASAPQANTSASYTPPPISAGNVPNRAAGNDSLSQVRGNVAGATPFGMTGQSGSAEDLKSAGNAASGYFNRPTSAANGLQNAASVSLPGGGSGNGGSGAGGSEQDKALGQDQNKDSKSAGESLAEKAAEQNQQHAIDLYWKKIEAEQMFPITEGQKVEDAMLMAPINAFTGIMTSELQGLFSPPSSGDTYNCGPNYSSVSACETVGSGGEGAVCADKSGGTSRQLAMCSAASGGGGSAGSTGVAAAPVSMSCPFPDTRGYGELCTLNASGAAAGTGANGGGSGFGATGGASVSNIGKDGGTTATQGSASVIATTMGQICSIAKNDQAPVKKVFGIIPGHTVVSPDELTDAPIVLQTAQNVSGQIYNLTGYYPQSCVGAAQSLKPKDQTDLGQINDAAGKLTAAWGDFNNVNGQTGQIWQSLSGPLCQGNPCKLGLIAQGNLPQNPSDFQTWWNNVVAQQTLFQQKNWQGPLNQITFSLSDADKNLTTATQELETVKSDVSGKSTPSFAPAVTSPKYQKLVASAQNELNKDYPEIISGLNKEVQLYQNGFNPGQPLYEQNVNTEGQVKLNADNSQTQTYLSVTGSQPQTNQSGGSAPAQTNLAPISLDTYYNDISQAAAQIPGYTSNPPSNTGACDSSCAQTQKQNIINYSQRENVFQAQAQTAQAALAGSMTQNNNTPPAGYSFTQTSSQGGWGGTPSASATPTPASQSSQPSGPYTNPD